MTKRRRDPAEVAALIEQGVERGLGLVESFLSVTGRSARGSSRTLAIEHQKAVEANRRDLARHRVRRQTLKSQVTGGAVVAGVGGALGLIDVVTETATSGAGIPFPAWTWLVAAGVGLAVSVRGRLRLRGLGPEPRPIPTIAPPPAMRGSGVGSAEIARFTSVRVQIINMAPALDHLYPGAGSELRRADMEAAGPLTALAERLVVLDQLQRELPGTSAAASAARSAELVRSRLADGCATYDELLAAAARLLAAPDTTRSTADILGPAVNAMLAYAHGLQRAADL